MPGSQHPNRGPRAPRGSRTAAPALDIDALRAGLDAGRLVRVSILPSGSFPEGATGRVRAIGDPAADGDEFLQIEIGTGRNRDILPFAPGDLAPYRRGGPPTASVTDIGAGRRRSSGLPAGSPAVPSPTLRRSGPSAKQGTPKVVPPKTVSPAIVSPAIVPPKAVTPAARTPTAGSGSPSDAASREAPATDVATADDRLSPDPELFPEPAGMAAPRVSAGRRAAPAKAKRSAVTITVSTDGESGWRVEARVGARLVVRPTTVTPSRVAEIVRELGDPRLIEVVDGLVAEHRRTVQARADQLAAELAGLQAELDLFPAD